MEARMDRAEESNGRNKHRACTASTCNTQTNESDLEKQAERLNSGLKFPSVASNCEFWYYRCYFVYIFLRSYVNKTSSCMSYI
jgi:hypothetical protein